MIVTVGHSNHSIDTFLALLEGAGVTALADVRSTPWSRRWPQYRKTELKLALEEAGIAYVWLGDALGGKPGDPALWTDGRPDRAKIAASPDFAAGIDRLIDGSARFQIAIMCAEKDPRQCHRTNLVTPALIAREIEVRHLLADGTIVAQADIMTGADDPARTAPDHFAGG